MKLIKYFIFVFRNRKKIQSFAWQLIANERNIDLHLRDIQNSLKVKIGDIRKFNKLTHEDCFNNEQITLTKSEAIMIIDRIQRITTIREEYMGEIKTIKTASNYLYK